MSTKKGICLVWVVAVCCATTVLASDANISVGLVDARHAENPVLRIGGDELWKENGTVFIRFAEKKGEGSVLELAELEPLADRTEFWGYYQGETVYGRLELVTSAAGEKRLDGSAKAVTTLKIEIVNGESVQKKQIRWSEPAAEPRTGQVTQSSAPATGAATAQAAVGGVRPLLRADVAELADLAIKECKCSTGYIYLCPDGDCDTSEDCNEDTGICQDFIIHDQS